MIIKDRVLYKFGTKRPTMKQRMVQNKANGAKLSNTIQFRWERGHSVEPGRSVSPPEGNTDPAEKVLGGVGRARSEHDGITYVPDSFNKIRGEAPQRFCDHGDALHPGRSTTF